MVLYRYVLKELAFPFLLTLGILVSILMMDQIYKFIPFLQATGLNFSYIVRMVIYTSPMTIMLATPISAMVGVYYGVQRLSQDSEIIAMRASGITLSFLFKPVLSLAAMIAVFVFFLSFFLNPMGITSMNHLEFEIIKQQAKVKLDAGRINNFFGQSMIYYQQKNGSKLEGVVIANWENPDTSLFFEAKEGEIQFNEETKSINFQLNDGRLHLGVKNNEPKRVVGFKQLDYSLTPKTKHYDYEFQQQKASTKGDVELTLIPIIQKINETTYPVVLLQYKDELHSRIIMVLSCFCFAMFALPFGVFDPRNPKPSKFVYMLLFLIAFNAFLAQLRSIYIQGEIPVITLYLPMVISIVIALVNFYKINYDLTSIKELIKFRSLLQFKKQ